jgi:acetyl-CoA carboxylase biotin carboxylase subunit
MWVRWPTRASASARPGARELSEHPAIIAACEITGAEAVHPGYGFLSENARFAEIVERPRLTFIGPKAEHIRMMGDKITAKQHRQGRSASPWCPARTAASPTEEAWPSSRQGDRLPRADQGRRRRRRARHEGRAPRPTSRGRPDRPTEAKAAFGDDAVYMERYLQKPRHIEIQVLADGFGNVDPPGRTRLLAAAPPPEGAGRRPLARPRRRRAREDRQGRRQCDAQAIGYLGVGTIEFLYENGEFFFIEMNTRLQVEHPVTEMITGIDLVREQIRIAAGLPLSSRRRTCLRRPRHRVPHQRRDPEDLRALAGLITDFHPPGGLGVRVDSAVYAGYSIPPYYDSADRQADRPRPRPRTECLMRLRRCLDEFVVGGIETTLPLFRTLVRKPTSRTATYDIHWLERRRSLLRREHVPPRARLLEAGAHPSGGASESRRLRAARHAIRDRAPPAVRRHRGPAQGLSRHARCRARARGGFRHLAAHGTGKHHRGYRSRAGAVAARTGNRGLTAAVADGVIGRAAAGPGVVRREEALLRLRARCHGSWRHRRAEAGRIRQAQRRVGRGQRAIGRHSRLWRLLGFRRERRGRIFRIVLLGRGLDDVLAAFALGEPDIIDRMLDRVQAGAGSEHPAGENLLVLVVRADFVDLHEGGGLRVLVFRARIADARSELERAELHGFIDRRLEGDDPPGDLVETGENSGRVLDLVGERGRGQRENREAASAESKTGAGETGTGNERRAAHAQPFIEAQGAGESQPASGAEGSH